MRIEPKVDGFVATKRGVVVRAHTVAIGFGVALALGVGVMAWLQDIGIPIAVILLCTSLVPASALLGDGSLLRLVVEVRMPRVICTHGAREQSALIARGAVSVGPRSIDVDPIEGPPLRIPTAGLAPATIDRLVTLLREAAAGDAGSGADVPLRLRGVAGRE